MIIAIRVITALKNLNTLNVELQCRLYLYFSFYHKSEFLYVYLHLGLIFPGDYFFKGLKIFILFFLMLQGFLVFLIILYLETSDKNLENYKAPVSL